jgi:hypothetical protein
VRKERSLLSNLIAVAVLSWCLGPVPTVNAAQAKEANAILRKVTGIPEYLSDKTEPFSVAFEIVDTDHRAYEEIEKGTATASFESEEFVQKNPEDLPVITQLSRTDVQGNLRYKVTFKDVIYVGKAEDKKVDAGTVQGAPLQTSSSNYGTFKVTVNYRIDDEAWSATVGKVVRQPKSNTIDKQPRPVPAPKIELKHCSFDKKTVNTGDSVVFDFAIINTSWNFELKNVKITVEGGESLIPDEGASNIFYSEKLGPRTEYTNKVPFYVAAVAAKGVDMPARVTLTIEAEWLKDNEMMKVDPFSAAASVIVRAETPTLNPSLKFVRSSKEISEGDDLEITVTVKNQTIARKNENMPTMYNPTVEFIAVDDFEFVTEPQPIDFPSLPDNTPHQQKRTLTPKYKRAPVAPVGEVPLGEPMAMGQAPVAAALPAPEQEQEFKGKVVLTYFDENQKEFKLEKPFTVKIKPQAQQFMGGAMDGGVFESPPVVEPEPEETGKKGTSKTVWIIGTLGTGVLIVVAAVVVKRVRAKRSLEEDDEDI